MIDHPLPTCHPPPPFLSYQVLRRAEGEWDEGQGVLPGYTVKKPPNLELRAQPGDTGRDNPDVLAGCPEYSETAPSGLLQQEGSLSLIHAAGRARYINITHPFLTEQ